MVKSNFNQWVKKFLFIHARSNKPDGRPLYAYKCHPKYYDELRNIIKDEYVIWHNDTTNITFDAFFCLFAAETWRRCHTGGPWKWETVFREIDQKVASPAWRSKVVRNGLSFWQRPILLDKQGNNQFLITIACEGGLPLQLLKNENAALAQYFRKLLEHYHIESKFTLPDAAQLAERLSPLLPLSLRRDIVFTLSGDLIKKIVELQDEVGDAVDPIAALDSEDPKWRNSLPLPLEDEAIERLLRNLVKEARALSITSRQQIRWRRILVRQNNTWTVEQILELPKTVSSTLLKAWLNKKSLPARMRLLLCTQEETKPIALLTRLSSNNENPSYRCELLSKEDIGFKGQQATGEVKLYVSDSEQNYELNIFGSEALAPLPWFFRESKGQMEFVGQGSIRTKAKSLYVLIDGGAFKYVDKSPQFIGDAPELNRKLFKVEGKGTWTHNELGQSVFTCDSSEERTHTILLKGPRLRITMDSDPPYIGIPDIMSVDTSGNIRMLRDVKVQWCPVGLRGTGWRTHALECAGEVWLRYLNGNDNIIFMKKTRVLPSSFKCEFIKIGAEKGEPGVLKITGTNSCRITCEEPQQFHFKTKEIEDGFEIECVSNANFPATHFNCLLNWPEGCNLSLRLPLLVRSALFMRADKPLIDGQMVAVSRLSSIRAIVQSPDSAVPIFIHAKLKAHSSWSDLMSLMEPIVFNESGRASYELMHIQERISSMLALTGDLDAFAELKIVNMQHEQLAHIKVGLFELKFMPDYNTKLLFPEFESIEQMEPDWESRITVKMIKLWDPAAEPILLNRYGGSVGWEVLIFLEPGPWLVLGEDGNWPRFRPILWNVHGESEATDDFMEQAIREPDGSIRQKLLEQLIQQMAKDPLHPAWLKFQDYLQLTRRYPASVFDFFRFFIKEPKAIVMSLMKSEEENFDLTWSLSEQLPFLWHLVPVKAWESAATRLYNSLHGALASIDGQTREKIIWDTFQKNRELLITRQPVFTQIFDWLIEKLYPDKQLNNSLLQVARLSPEKIIELITQHEHEFQERHDSNEYYPTAKHLMNFVEQKSFPDHFKYSHLAYHLRPVRCAPFVAARIALEGYKYNNFMLVEFQHLRLFDREWFDTAFALGLCLELATFSTEGDGSCATPTPFPH